MKKTATRGAAARVTRGEIEANDRPDADPANTLFTIADDIDRIRGRITRLKDKNAHAEHPRSRTRRLISNVRVVGRNAKELRVESNFAIHRFRRGASAREYVGHYRHLLRIERGRLRIARREAVLDAMELGSLGLVSFLL